MLRNRFSFLLILVCFSSIYFDSFVSADVVVNATVDKLEISLDELLQFSISIEGMDSSDKNPKINLPQIEESFSIIASSQSNRMNFQNGKLDMSWQIQYTLLPKKEGQLKIDSVEIIYKDDSYKTQEVTIKVNPPKIPKKQPQKQTIPQKVPWSSQEGIYI
ncbi:MAG: BatD family protein [Candidatus Omnitrophota bacterium]